MSDEFHAPRLDAPIDLDAHLRLLPRNATCKGLFFLSAIRLLREAERLDVLRPLGLDGRRFLPFFDYPYADLLRLNVATGAAVYPDESPGEGVRRMGQAAYDALLESRVGRVIFGALGLRFGLVVRHGPKGWQVAQNFGHATIEDLADKHVRVHIHEMPALLETAQVGAVEGAMRACQTKGEVRVKMRSLASAVFDVQWV